jgi:hypothetical protein
VQNRLQNPQISLAGRFFSSLLGPGEVYARPEYLAQWKFAFDFEKALLFSREPGGGGEVVELQRM